MPLKQTMTLYPFLILLAVVPALAIPVSPLAPRDGITWSNCEAFPWLDQQLQCANISVPINWDAPDGDTFTLGMVRLSRPSNSSAERIGHLFINPGGPGGSAVTYVANIASGFVNVSPDILNSFDLIGVDPRGVSQSARSYCDWNIWAERVSLFPKTQEDYDHLVDKNRRLGESCLNQTGDIINYLDTISTAKDHEAVRAALGEQMNWLGLSYGTQLGAQYAQLFPDKIRVMVLDGILQHSQSEATNILIESTTYALELEEAFKWAATNDASPLKGQDVEKLWYSILKTAADKPIPNSNCDPNNSYCYANVTEEEILFNAQGFLISATEAARLNFANALLQASEGDATAFSSVLPGPGDPSLFPGITIGCQDWSPTASSFEDFQAKMRMAAVLAPLNRGASQSWTVQAACVGWPAPPRNRPSKLKIQTQDPILMVNAIRDPSTSYVWAVGMLEEIENSVLLTRNGDGHTSWGSINYAGATVAAIDHFLITKEAPAPGTVLDS
jgi:pimeloyl-ACP methyl ester carboxylesterase